MKSTKTIWVNPVDRVSAQGRHQQVYTVKNGNEIVPIKTMGKTREFGTTFEIAFQEDSEKMKLDTGFDEQIQNPWYKLDPAELKTKYGLPSAWNDLLPDIVESKEITKQVYFEIKHGVKPDLYTSNLEWTFTKLPRDMSKLDNPPYLKTLKCILYPDRLNEFSNDTPRSELLIEMITRNDQVAPSKAEANSGLHNFYISDENFEESEKAAKNDKIEEANFHLYKLKNLATPFLAYQIATLLTNKDGNNIIKGEVSDAVLKNALSKYIDKGKSQLSNINKFLELVGLAETLEGKERLNIMYLVQQAINTRVMGIRDGHYIWYSKADIPNVYKISTDYDKVIKFFLDEFTKYSPKSDVTNWYAELLSEVSNQNVRFE